MTSALRGNTASRRSASHGRAAAGSPELRAGAEGNVPTRSMGTRENGHPDRLPVIIVIIIVVVALRGLWRFAVSDLALRGLRLRLWRFAVSDFVFCFWRDISLKGAKALGMLRRLRIEFEGAIYHVMARGNPGRKPSAMMRTVDARSRDSNMP